VNSFRRTLYTLIAILIAALTAHPTNAQSTARTKVILDTDMIELFDDGAAMLMLERSPKIELLGVTVVAGNGTMPFGVATGVRQLEALNSKTPIYEGSRLGIRNTRASRLYPEAFAAEQAIAPVTGFGGYILPGGDMYTKDGVDSDPLANWLDVYKFRYKESPTYKNVYGLNHPDPDGNDDAVDFLVHTVNKYPGQITIVAIGPLTNIARAILKDPSFSSKVARIVYMGGAFFVPGNSSSAAEFNWWADPEAAKISVRAKWGDTKSDTFASYGNQVIFGLEANNHTSGMPEDQYRKMVDGTFPGIKKLWLEREAAMKAQGATVFGPPAVWDLLCSAYVIDPSIVLSWNNFPKPANGSPAPIAGVFVDVNSEMGLDYGRSQAFTNNDEPTKPVLKGPAATQKAAIANYIDAKKFWEQLVVPLHQDPNHKN
jgi:inosine-uridine nucleoside N-ribohydrolase